MTSKGSANPFEMGTDNDKLVCPYCARSYQDKVTLRGHIRRSHPYKTRTAQAIGKNRAIKTGAISSQLSVGTSTALPYTTVHRSPEPINREQSTSAAAENLLHAQRNKENDSFPQHEEEEVVESARDFLEYDDVAIEEENVQKECFENNPNVSRKVISFFTNYGDTSEPLYPTLSRLDPDVDTLHETTKEVLKYCMRLQLSMGEARSLFELVHRIEHLLPREFRYVSSEFEHADSFADYLDKLRKWTVRKEGWKTAVIKTSFGENRTGVFRSALDVVLGKISEVGTASLLPFQECFSEHGRVYSNPCDSEAMEQFHKCHRLGGKIVGMDLYSDGTILAKSGSQSANCMRIRFVNLKNHSSEWHEVGIAPTVDSSINMRSDAEKRRERCQLFQRFLFLVLQDSIMASHHGVSCQGIMLFPRVVMVIADQPQERVFFCLKGSDSYADCSLCLMPSRLRVEKASSLKQQNLTQESETGPYQVSEQQPCSIAHMREMIFELQTSSDNAKERDVCKTVMAQVLVADARRKRDEQRQQTNLFAANSFLKHLHEYLESVSAIEFPPALAAFAGLATEPYRLYNTIGFDKLHVIEHGLLRQATDEAFRAFESSSAYNGMSKGEIVSIANQRILDVPRSARIAKFAPYRIMGTEKHSGVSGKVRRELSPFLWYSLMGISRTVSPDDDPMVQVMLSMDRLQKELFGINNHPRTGFRTIEQLTKLQRNCFELGRDMSKALCLPVNTKVHRVMRHIIDHFVSFGCIRKGATDDNEALHKTTKRAYSSTNQHLPQIAPQLLSARAHAYSSQQDDTEASSLFRLLLTRDAIVSTDQSAAITYSRLTPTFTTPVVELKRLVALRYSRNDETCQDIQNLEEVVLKETHRSMLTAVWKKVKSVTFIARFPWMQEYKVRQTIYSGDNVFGIKNRRDAVIYRNNGQDEYGIVQSIFTHMSFDQSRVLFIRRLRSVEPEHGNMKVTKVFGHSRFAYVMSGSDVELAVVGPESLVRSVILIPDPYLVSRIYGRKQRMSTLPDTPEARRLIRYFEVTGYKYTSLPEQSH